VQGSPKQPDPARPKAIAPFPSPVGSCEWSVSIGFRTFVRGT
jgi:hypothetical protein